MSREGERLKFDGLWLTLACSSFLLLVHTICAMRVCILFDFFCEGSRQMVEKLDRMVIYISVLERKLYCLLL